MVDKTNFDFSVSKSCLRLEQQEYQSKETCYNANNNIHNSLQNANHLTTNRKSLPNILYNYTTVQNLSIWGCEFAPTVRESMKSWNCSVQYWLANYFYKRCYGPKNFRCVCLTLFFFARIFCRLKF